MVPTCQDTANHEEQEGAKNMNLQIEKSTTQEQGPKMIVFSQKEFQGMDINGINVGATEERRRSILRKRGDRDLCMEYSTL
jgi:hypothetical protein